MRSDGGFRRQGWRIVEIAHVGSWTDRLLVAHVYSGSKVLFKAIGFVRMIYLSFHLTVFNDT